MVEPLVAIQEVARSNRVIRSKFPNRGMRSLVQCGVVAQLGERENGILEAVGSIPSGSTNLSNLDTVQVCCICSGAVDTMI